jgi:hypothetical protein
VYSTNPTRIGIQETPAEKFNRLKAELYELKEGLTLLTNKVGIFKKKKKLKKIRRFSE